LIVETEDALFERWESSHEAGKIVRDGLVNECSYIQSYPKILFLLKEANDSGGGGWDLREFVRDGAKANTWKVLTQWTEVIRKFPNLPLAEELEHAWTDKAYRKRLLESIGAMNLKKVPGSGVANKNQIREACTTHAELLRQQYELYVPDLVIFCGSPVADCFCEYLYPEYRGKWEERDGQKTDEKFSYLRLAGDSRFALDWWHPQQRGLLRATIIAELHHALCSLHLLQT
jgi:hypothetical protein